MISRLILLLALLLALFSETQPWLVTHPFKNPYKDLDRSHFGPPEKAWSLYPFDARFWLQPGFQQSIEGADVLPIDPTDISEVSFEGMRDMGFTYRYWPHFVTRSEEWRPAAKPPEAVTLRICLALWLLFYALLGTTPWLARVYPRARALPWVLRGLSLGFSVCCVGGLWHVLHTEHIEAGSGMRLLTCAAILHTFGMLLPQRHISFMRPLPPRQRLRIARGVLLLSLVAAGAALAFPWITRFPGYEKYWGDRPLMPTIGAYWVGYLNSVAAVFRSFRASRMSIAMELAGHAGFCLWLLASPWLAAFYARARPLLWIVRLVAIGFLAYSARGIAETYQLWGYPGPGQVLVAAAIVIHLAGLFLVPKEEREEIQSTKS